MKHLRQLILILCGWLVLQPCLVMGIQAQPLPGEPAPQQTSDFQHLSTEDALNQAIKWAKYGQQPDTNTIIDTGISIISLGFPPAGAALGFFKQFLLSGATGSDPVGDALNVINNHLAEIDQHLNTLDQEVKQINDRFSKNENHARILRLTDISADVKLRTNQLQSHPTSDFDKTTVVGQARIDADKFLDDPDLWNWSDFHVFTDKNTGQLTQDGYLPAHFEPQPALDYYASSLTLWMSAIEYASGGDPKYVTNNTPLVNDLLRHAAYLSVRPSWHELDSQNTPDPPQTLPENIMRSVHSYVQPVSTYPTNRMCNASRYVDDFFRRTRTLVDTAQFSMPSDNTLCTLSMPAPKSAPADISQNPVYGSEAMALWQKWRTPPVLAQEDELEQSYGIETMTLLADKLVRLAKFGTTREQFIGTFGTTPANYRPAFVYAAANNGDLMWFRQESNASTWVGPRKVGNGWNFKDIIPAGGNRFYALTEGGILKWYQHNGFNDGSSDWKGPVDVGRGWRFAKIFSGSDGIVYAIKDDGTLVWYSHGGFADGGGINTWTGPKVVGSGWGQFKDVFSMGQGIIYAVKQDGQLLWYKHTDYLSGTSRSDMRPERAHWEGPTPVGTGWQNFRAIIPIGDGIILAVTDDGRMLWYKHADYLTGTSRTDVRPARAHWEGPTQIGAGWRGFRKVTAILPATPVGPR